MVLWVRDRSDGGGAAAARNRLGKQFRGHSARCADAARSGSHRAPPAATTRCAHARRKHATFDRARRPIDRRRARPRSRAPLRFSSQRFDQILGSPSRARATRRRRPWRHSRRARARRGASCRHARRGRPSRAHHIRHRHAASEGKGATVASRPLPRAATQHRVASSARRRATSHRRRLAACDSRARDIRRVTVASPWARRRAPREGRSRRLVEDGRSSFRPSGAQTSQCGT